MATVDVIPDGADLLIDGRPYVCYWSNREAVANPLLSIVKKPERRDVQQAPLTQAGGKVDETELDFPKRMVMLDWRAGAGQASYDSPQAVSNRFLSSRNIETSIDGHLRLGPWTDFLQDTRAGDLCCIGPSPYGGYTVYGSFIEQSGGVYVNQIRYLAGSETWVPVDFNGTAPTYLCTALCSDDQYLYAAFTNGAVDAGSVWWSKLTDGGWTKLGDLSNVTAMVCAGGVLWCARDGYTETLVEGQSDTKVISGVGTYQPTGAAGAWAFDRVSPSRFYLGTSLGLARVGNMVYWATCNAAQTVVYVLDLGNVDAPFRLVAEMPDGFVGTCLSGYASMGFVGGYYRAGFDDPELDYRSSVYLVSEDGSSHLFTIGGEDAQLGKELRYNRLRALCPWGRYLYALCDEDVYRWHLTDQGGYAHLAEVPQGRTYEETGTTWLEQSYDTATANLPQDEGWARVFTGDDATVEVLQNMLIVHVPDGSSTRYRKEVELGTEFTAQVELGQRSDLPKVMGTAEFILRNEERTFRLRLRGWETEHHTHDPYIMLAVDIGKYTTDGGETWVPFGPWKVLYSEYAPKVTITVEDRLVKLYWGEELVGHVHQGGTPLETDDKNANWQAFTCGPTDGTRDRIGEDLNLRAFRFQQGIYPPGMSPQVVEGKSMVVMDGDVFAPLPATGIVRIRRSVVTTYTSVPEVYELEGRIRSSRTALHMGSVQKSFWWLDIGHEPLRESETIEARVHFDHGGYAGQTFAYDEDDPGKRRSRLTLAESASSVEVELLLTGEHEEGDLYATHTPDITSLEVAFMPPNNRQYEVYLDCRDGALDTRGRKWQGNPVEDAEFIEERAKDQRPVTIVTRLRSLTAVIEQYNYSIAMTDETPTSGPLSEGVVALVLREVQ